MTTNDLIRLAPRPDQPPATPVHRHPVTGPGAWKTTDFASPRDYTIELTGDTRKLDAFIQALDQGSIIETVRTGASGIGRGNRILRV